MHSINTKAMLLKAQKEGYAVGHFNTSNIEITQAIREAAEEMHAPIIIGCSQGAIDYAGLKVLVPMIQHALEKKDAPSARVPFAIHLDHGPSFSLAKQCIDAGFTSVMIDSSAFPFSQNIAITKRVISYARPRGVSVEAELGLLKGVEDYLDVKNESLTSPKKAAEFVKRTNCDSLAVAIGTSHGAHKFSGRAKLDLNRLEEIRRKVSIPLVLHGASSVYPDVIRKVDYFGAQIKQAHGVPDSILRKCISRGICKINTDTDLRLAFDLGIRKFLKKNPEVYDYRKILSAGKESVKEMVKRKIKVFGSEGRA